MRLCKVTLKPGVAEQEDWNYLWDLFHGIVGEAREQSDVWRCFRPFETGRNETHEFWRVRSVRL